MQFGSVKLEKSEGSILAHSIKFGNLHIKKGTILEKKHILDLKNEGVQSVIVARLENGDIEENKSATIISETFSHNSLIFSKANTGRINIFSKYDGLLLYNISSIINFNLIDEGIALSLLPQNTFVKNKQLIGTLKVIPYSLSKRTILKFCGFENLIIIKSFKEKKFSLIQTSYSNMRQSFLMKTITETKKRVENLGCSLLNNIICRHNEKELASKIKTRISKDIDILLISCASAVSDRNDILPKSIVDLGGDIIHFGLPVDPGNLLILASLNNKFLVGMPGCARSPSLNGLDLILRMLVADINIDKQIIASLGVGGLLKDTKLRPFPRNKIK